MTCINTGNQLAENKRFSVNPLLIEYNPITASLSISSDDYQSFLFNQYCFPVLNCNKGGPLTIREFATGAYYEYPRFLFKSKIKYPGNFPQQYLELSTLFVSKTRFFLP